MGGFVKLPVDLDTCFLLKLMVIGHSDTVTGAINSTQLVLHASPSSTLIWHIALLDILRCLQMQIRGLVRFLELLLKIPLGSYLPSGASQYLSKSIPKALSHGHIRAL